MSGIFRFRTRLISLAAVVSLATGASFGASTLASGTADIPSSLSDREFWELVEQISEPNGEFQSDNFMSNEQGYQIVIPELMDRAKPGRVYLGVGPEQNFPYILALKPALSIIFDIRRGNLHEHLLYKALFEMSEDRADFLSRLFSRKRPDGLTREASVMALMSAYIDVEPSAELYAANLAAVSAWLTKRHGFDLQPGDLEGIDYVYRTAFFDGGPLLTYNMAGRGSRGGFGRNGSATYALIQSLDDGRGINRGFLGSEENWAWMKDYHSRNLLVPVVGDFAGPKAIRAVGAYLKARNTTVSAFYLSNVEQYLNRSGVEDVFLCNVATLPLDETSTFIYTGAGRSGFGRGGGGLNTTFLRFMMPDTQGCTLQSEVSVPAAMVTP